MAFAAVKPSAKRSCTALLEQPSRMSICDHRIPIGICQHEAVTRAETQLIGVHDTNNKRACSQSVAVQKAPERKIVT